MSWKKQLFILLMCLCIYLASGTFLGSWIKSYSSLNQAKTGVARGKKKKFMGPLIITILMMKAVILPIMFKTMAVMAGTSVMLSLLSLVVSSIIGFTKHALYHIQPSYKVFHIGAGVKELPIIPHEPLPYHHEDLGEHEILEHPPLVDHEPIY